MTSPTELHIQIDRAPRWAPGHFPGDPILPGAKLLDLVIEALTRARVLPDAGCQIAQSKFSAPVRPGDTIALTWKAAGSRLQFVCTVGAMTVASGQITGIRPAGPSDES